MKGFILALTALVVALVAGQAHAQRCQGGRGSPSVTSTGTTGVVLVPMTDSASLTTAASQQAYLRQLAYQQQLQQQAIQQQAVQMQIAQERMARAQKDRERRDRKLEVHRERRATEVAKREQTRQKNLARRDGDTRIAAKDQAPDRSDDIKTGLGEL